MSTYPLVTKNLDVKSISSYFLASSSSISYSSVIGRFSSSSFLDYVSSNPLSLSSALASLSMIYSFFYSIS